MDDHTTASFPDGTTTHVQTAIQRLPSDPINSLRYIRDIILYTLSINDLEIETPEIHTPTQLSFHSEFSATLNKKVVFDNPAVEDLATVVVNDGGTSFLRELVLQFNQPPVTLDDTGPAETVWDLVSNVLWLLFHISLEFRQIFLAEALASFVDYLYTDSTSGGQRRKSSAMIVSVATNEDMCAKELQSRFRTEDPWRTVIVMQDLLLAGTGVPELIRFGAFDTLAQCIGNLRPVSNAGIKAFTFVVKEILRLADLKRHKSCNADPETLNCPATRVRVAVETHFLTPTIVSALVQEWLTQVDLVPSASLSEVIAEILGHNGSVRSQVVDLILKSLEGLDVDSVPGESVTIALSTLFGQPAVPLDAKRSLYRQFGIVDVLVTMLSTPRTRASPPYSAEHFAAHALAILVPMDTAVRQVHDALLAPPGRFPAVLQTLLFIADYDPFAKVRSAVGNGPMGAALLLDTVLDQWSDVATPLCDKFFSETFNHELNEFPSYGAGLLLRRLSPPDVVDGLLNSGAVPFCFRILGSTVIGERPWLNAMLVLARLAQHDPGVVDISSANHIDTILQSLRGTGDSATEVTQAQFATAGLITAVLQSSAEEETALGLLQAGVADALVAIILNDESKISAVTASVTALKEMMALSDEVRDNIASREQLVWALVELLFWGDPIVNEITLFDPERNESTPLVPSTEAAELLAYFYKTGTEYLRASITTRLSYASTFADKVLLLAPLDKALTIEHPSHALHASIVAAGIIPFLFELAADPAFLIPTNHAVRRQVATMLTTSVAGQSWQTYAYRPLLGTAPGIIQVYIDWVKGPSHHLKASAVAGLIDVLGWDFSDLHLEGAGISVKVDYEYVRRAQMLDKGAGLADVLVGEMQRRTAVRLSPDHEFSELVLKEEQDQVRAKALELLDALTSDKATFSQAKALLVNAGAMDALKELRKVRYTRGYANRMVKRLQQDRLLDDDEMTESGYDSECFDVLCDLLVDPTVDLQEKSMAMRELVPISTSQYARDSLAQRPDVVKFLVDTIFMMPHDVAGKTDYFEEQELTDRESDEMKLSARDVFDNVNVAEPLRALPLLTVAYIRDKLTDNSKVSCPKEGLSLLSSIHFAAETSQGGICKLFVFAGLPDFIVSVLRNPEVTTISVKTAIDIIEDFASSNLVDGTATAFLVAGVVPALADIIRTASMSALDGFRRLSPFKALAALVAHSPTGASDRRDIFQDVIDVVPLAVAELQRITAPVDAPETPDADLTDEVKDWNTLLALTSARIAPLTFLDRLLSDPEVFSEVKESFKSADVEDVLTLIRDDSREPGPYDYGTQEDMSRLARELSDRLARDELSARLPCKCWRCDRAAIAKVPNGFVSDVETP